MRVLCDVHIPYRLVSWLRERGVDATHMNRRRLLPKNAFTHGASMLVGGTAGPQLLRVLAAPLLTRLYSPDDFGLLAVYASLSALIGGTSSLRYELAFPLPENVFNCTKAS